MTTPQSEEKHFGPGKWDEALTCMFRHLEVIHRAFPCETCGGSWVVPVDVPTGRPLKRLPECPVGVKTVEKGGRP